MSSKAAILLAAVALMLPPPARSAEQFTQRFGSGSINPRLLKLIGPPTAFKQIQSGLMVTLPAEGTQAGAETMFSVGGDFEITAAYELIDLPQPEVGYGPGVILRLSKVDSDDFAALGRRRQRDGSDVFNANNSKSVRGQRKHDQKFYEAERTGGELRIVRHGPTLTFLVKDGDAEGFRELRQVPFGTAPLKSVKFLADTGGSQKKMTARLTSLSIRAEALPYGIPTSPARFAWTTWRILGAAGVLVLIGSCVWFWRSKRTMRSQRT